MKTTKAAICLCCLVFSSYACMRETRRAPPSREVVSLTDGQVASVLASLDTGEVDMAQTARPKLRGKPAQEFAAMMVDMHTKSGEEMKRLLESQSIQPTPSAAARSVDSSGAEVVQQIVSTEGDADSEYLSSQLKAHRAALVLLDCVLSPSTKNTPLKNAIESKVRPMVQEHFEKAREVAGAPVPVIVNCAAVCDPSLQGGELPDGVRAAVCSP